MSHSKGRMNLSDIQFYTSVESTYVTYVTFENGKREEYIRNRIYIDPTFGANNVLKYVPSNFSGESPLLITITVNTSVNLGNGSIFYPWFGKERLNYTQP